MKPEKRNSSHADKEDKTSTLIQGSGSNYKSPGCFRQRVQPLYPHPLFQTRKRQTIQTLGNCLFLKKVDSILTLKINNSISVRNPLTLLPAEVDLFS